MCKEDCDELIQVAVEKEKKFLRNHYSNNEKENRQKHRETVEALLKVNKLLHDENEELKRDRDNYLKWLIEASADLKQLRETKNN